MIKSGNRWLLVYDSMNYVRERKLEIQARLCKPVSRLSCQHTLKVKSLCKATVKGVTTLHYSR